MIIPLPTMNRRSATYMTRSKGLFRNHQKARQRKRREQTGTGLAGGVAGGHEDGVEGDVARPGGTGLSGRQSRDRLQRVTLQRGQASPDRTTTYIRILLMPSYSISLLKQKYGIFAVCKNWSHPSFQKTILVRTILLFRKHHPPSV